MKKTKLVAEIEVGTYRLGWRWVLLRAKPGTSDGAGYFAPDEKKITVIDVGIRGRWPMTVATLLHEVFETAASEFELRYAPIGNLGNSSANNLFVLTHCQFSEVTDRAGDFMANCLPALQKVWKKHHPKEKSI